MGSWVIGFLQSLAWHLLYIFFRLAIALPFAAFQITSYILLYERQQYQPLRLSVQVKHLIFRRY